MEKSCNKNFILFVRSKEWYTGSQNILKEEFMATLAQLKNRLEQKKAKVAKLTEQLKDEKAQLADIKEQIKSAK